MVELQSNRSRFVVVTIVLSARHFSISRSQQNVLTCVTGFLTRAHGQRKTCAEAAHSPSNVVVNCGARCKKILQLATARNSKIPTANCWLRIAIQSAQKLLVRHPDTQKNFTRICRQLLSAKYAEFLLSTMVKIP